MVGHLRGRQLNPTKIQIYRADVSKRIERLKEFNLGDSLSFNDNILCVRAQGHVLYVLFHVMTDTRSTVLALQHLCMLTPTHAI